MLRGRFFARRGGLLGRRRRGQLRTFTPTNRQLTSGDRLILVTDGITQRRTNTGTFGTNGIRQALTTIEHPTAAATAMAILQAVTNAWNEPLQDDGTTVVLAIT